MRKTCMMTLCLLLLGGVMAHAQTEVKGGWEQFGVANADTVVKLNRTEMVAGNKSKIFYGDARKAFAVSLSICCHTLGTEQVFLCKDGRGGEKFADLSVGYDNMQRHVFVEVKDEKGMLHRFAAGEEVKKDQWYQVEVVGNYDAVSQKTTLCLSVDGKKKAYTYDGYALPYTVGRWVVGHGFPGGFPNSLQVLDGEVAHVQIAVTGIDRKEGENPLFTDRFTADPACTVIGDRTYAYVGEDKAGVGGWFYMPQWLCYSSDDMVHWTAHGPVLQAGDFPNANPNGAWAGQVVENKGKYYYYVTLDDKRNGKHMIDVAVGDTPLGPFRPARKDGTPMITDDMTLDSHRANADIDPTVLIDDDGTPWMAWGNGDCYMVKLKKNMIELDGEMKKVPFRNYSEGPWLFKRGDYYYNVYAADAPGVQPEQIAYSYARSIEGPWTYGGLLTGPAKYGFTIHPSVNEFKGKWYFFYHDGSYMLNGEPGGDCRRQVCVEPLYFNADGTIQPITLTREGVSAISCQQAQSPDGRLSLTQKQGGFVLSRNGQTVLDIPMVGLGASPVTPTGALTFVRNIHEDYTMLAGKRLHCTNDANEYQTLLGDGSRLVMRLYNDGLAFRYELTGLNGQAALQEQTTYRIPDGTRRWMQKWVDCYEEFFPLSTANVEKGRWGYPSLLQPADDVFALITEANIERRQSASCLFSEGELFRVTPDENTVPLTGDWHTPWRVVIVGSLEDVVASTLVTDVSEPCRVKDTSWIQPGVVSWIYWAYNHGSNDYKIIKKYVDMAVTLHLPYVLIDAEWDEMKDGKTIEDAVKYAKSQGVKPLIWYNSSVGWVDGAPGPKFRLNKPKDREREFAWCEKLGVAGVKIDFFSGDNQMNMDYCQELLECAARHHLLVNFHGATLPRGWQRTYPNLLSTEGVYGAEWYNNVPTFTDRAARHNATLPFTRNVVGPMDYTPCTFSDSQHPHITTHAHELALTVLYESGLQHLADRPESYLAQPAEVQQFFGQLPSVWDETHLLAGYPGESVVMARRRGTTWYVAGINGTDEVKDIALPLSTILTASAPATVFMDSTDKEHPWDIRTTDTAQVPTTLKCQPRGGFVLVIAAE